MMAKFDSIDMGVDKELKAENERLRGNIEVYEHVLKSKGIKITVGLEALKEAE